MAITIIVTLKKKYNGIMRQFLPSKILYIQVYWQKNKNQFGTIIRKRYKRGDTNNFSLPYYFIICDDIILKSVFVIT